jgi:hypothetical protein
VVLKRSAVADLDPPPSLGSPSRDYAGALRVALDYVPADAPATATLRELARLLRDNGTLSAGETAQLLGVRSANTVKNWLQSGAFPGATRTQGGHWRFPLEEVLKVKAQIRDVRARNAAGDIRPVRTSRVVWGDDEIA